MSTDFNPTNNSLNAKEYTSTFELALQQKDSYLSAKVKNISGTNADKVQEIVRYDEVNMQTMSGLNATISQQSMPFTQRWVKGERFYASQLLNNIQQLQDMVQNPSSAIAQVQAAAARRKMDEVILKQFFTSALTGTDAGQTTAFDTTNNVVGVNVGGTTSGLNIEKLLNVVELMQKNEIVLEEEPAYAVITEIQLKDLRQKVEAMNADYQAAHAVVRDSRGGIKSILGIELCVISSTRLASYVTDARLLDGSSYRRVPVFTMKGMALCTWKAQSTRIDDRQDLQGVPKQFYIEQYIGATRSDEQRVFEIKCNEA